MRVVCRYWEIRDVRSCIVMSHRALGEINARITNLYDRVRFVSKNAVYDYATKFYRQARKNLANFSK